MSIKNIQVNIPGWAIITAALILVAGLGVGATQATGRFNLPLSWILTSTGQSIDPNMDNKIDKEFLEVPVPGLGAVLSQNNNASDTPIVGLATSTATDSAATKGYVDSNIPDAMFLDQDGDGYTPAEGDCDDSDANINPGETEIGNCADGKDNNCNNLTDTGDEECSCYGKSDATTTSNGEIVYCDTSSRMWSPTADIGTTTAQYQWYPAEANTIDSCVGAGSTYPACDYCDRLSYAGISNWELPSCESGTSSNCVLYDLYADSGNGGGWDPNAQADDYWSSTEAEYDGDGWIVNFSDGTLTSLSKNWENCFVRCVLGQ